MYEEFYKNGISDIDFKCNHLDDIMKNILQKKLKKGFNLNSKYPGAYDLRPNVFDYDPVFIDVLKKNNIKKLIKGITLKDMSLFHIQVRVVDKNNSYMDWHRDTYYNQDNKLVGKAPHGVKIIYYPDFDNQEEDRLKYLMGSNRVLFPNNQYDNELFKILNVKKIKASSSKAILFDVNGLHAVCPEKPNKKSIRLIYSFLDKKQIINDHNNEDVHTNAMKLYEDL